MYLAFQITDVEVLSVLFKLIDPPYFKILGGIDEWSWNHDEFLACRKLENLRVFKLQNAISKGDATKKVYIWKFSRLRHAKKWAKYILLLIQILEDFGWGDRPPPTLFRGRFGRKGGGRLV